MIDIMPGVPLVFKALILLGFILVMIGIAGLVLVIGRKKKAKNTDTYDIVKKNRKAAKTAKAPKIKESKKSAAPVPDIESWDDEEPVVAFGKAKQDTKPAQAAPAQTFQPPVVQPAAAPTLQPKAAPAPTQTFQPPVVQPAAPVVTPVEEQKETPKPKTGGPFGASNLDADETEW